MIFGTQGSLMQWRVDSHEPTLHTVIIHCRIVYHSFSYNARAFAYFFHFHFRFPFLLSVFLASPGRCAGKAFRAMLSCGVAKGTTEGPFRLFAFVFSEREPASVWGGGTLCGAAA